MRYIDDKIWHITGPDGGFCHVWKCDSCGTEGTYTDK